MNYRNSRLPITQKMLMDWAGPRVFRDGRRIFGENLVRSVDFDYPQVTGELTYGSRGLNCRYRIHDDGSVSNECPCRDNTERGIICSHVVALGLELIRRNTDPQRAQKAEEEARRAARIEHIDESEYLTRVSPDDPAGIPSELIIVLEQDWYKGRLTDAMPLRIWLKVGDDLLPPPDVARDLKLAFGQRDENLLYVLEDICAGPLQETVLSSQRDFINLLELMKDKPFKSDMGPQDVYVSDEMAETAVQVSFNEDNGELNILLDVTRPASDDVSYFVVANNKGYVFHDQRFYRLNTVLPIPMQQLYFSAVQIERPDVLRFINTEMSLLSGIMQVHSDISQEYFEVLPAEPQFHVHIKGSPASITAELKAVYGDTVLIAGRADAAGQFALPDPEDILRYYVRNGDREKEALAVLAALEFRGAHGGDLSAIIGNREVLNFIGTGLPALRRRGWMVTLEGRVEPFVEAAEFVTPVVYMQGSENGWFDVQFEYEPHEGESLREADIQRAMLKGEAYIEQGGRTYFLDADAIDEARAIFEDCETGEGSHPGSFQVPALYSGYIQSSLNGIDGVDVEASQEWLQRSREVNRDAKVEPMPLPGTLDEQLRPYQKEGVYWLRFLEQQRFNGILADEMGLGKTIQALAWLRLDRIHPEAQGRPALVVCPTSLVENWADEAERFVPDMTYLIMSGADRHEHWERVEHTELVITSYALLRRDVEEYTSRDFSVIILDEAQHIKNRNTQNAVAAKKVKAPHRLVLTGTPVENSVADLWSIMDFLMPRYLGTYDVFRTRYELPIGRFDDEGMQAQRRLRKKLHPFLMRRLKKDVTPELPEKIQRLASVSLTKDQQKVYKEILEQSRRRISNMVMKHGFQKSRMEILKTLLRLRQTCCHLDLLKLPDLKSQYPSAKMELLFELMDEALDSGGRILLFSQFTSMLKLIRKELDDRDIRHLYLDGSTKNRLSLVKEFNLNRNIPIFLISLKAGGTGLNLASADTVIHFDPWWNPAVEDQATDRAYRIGQERTVYSIKLITKGTVEEKVLEMQQRKKRVIDATVEKDGAMVSSMNWDDVQQLLSL